QDIGHNCTKTTHSFAVRRFSRTGIAAMTLLCCATLGLAQESSPTPRAVREATVMAERYTDQQRQIVREILQAAMRLLRDDVPLEKVKAFFGESWKISPLSGNAFAKEYRFEHPALRNTDMRLYVESDPEDFREDRSKVAQVPTYFEIHFTPLLDKLAVEELEGLLQLKGGSYQFGDGEVIPYNLFPADPLTPFAEPYRFQALEVPGSKFPVKVQLDYIRPGAQPPEQGGLTSTVLAEVRSKRDYPVLTQEERKTRAREMPVSLRQLSAVIDAAIPRVVPFGNLDGHVGRSHRLDLLKALAIDDFKADGPIDPRGILGVDAEPLALQ
ncbi:hypothetical protein, partial [Cupriavidus basilensis]|uniref:hypothetical protein n=1 Tax=Cupriavidus basilensis TaxID=68895 RepID=UPI002852CBBC